MSATILIGITCWIWPFSEQGAEFLLAQHAVFDQQKIVNQHAFFIEPVAKGGIEPGVMPPMSA